MAHIDAEKDKIKKFLDCIEKSRRKEDCDGKH